MLWSKIRMEESIIYKLPASKVLQTEIEQLTREKKRKNERQDYP